MSIRECKAAPSASSDRYQPSIDVVNAAGAVVGDRIQALRFGIDGSAPSPGLGPGFERPWAARRAHRATDSWLCADAGRLRGCRRSVGVEDLARVFHQSRARGPGAAPASRRSAPTSAGSRGRRPSPPCRPRSRRRCTRSRRTGPSRRGRSCSSGCSSAGSARGRPATARRGAARSRRSRSGRTSIRWPNRRTVTALRRRLQPRPPAAATSACDRPPLVAVREPVPGQRLRPHLRAVAGSRRQDVARVADLDRIEEVLVEVVDVLDHPALERAADTRCSRWRPGAGRARTARHRRRAGQTGMPNSAAISRTAMTSFTPPRRAASIWQTAIASAWNSCLNITRLWTCSPVATRIGATARAIAAWPRMSSGLVGSSIQYGSNSRQVGHPRDRLRRRPSAGSRRPPSSRQARSPRGRSRARRRSSSRSAPTFSLNARPAFGERLAAEPPDLVVVVAEPADRGRVRGVARPAGARPRGAARLGASARSRSRARSGGRASEMYRKSTSATISSGVMSTTSFQSGLPAVFANRSQTAFTTAAVARCITPFSGPIQRSWLSPTSCRQNAPMSANSSSVDRPSDERPERLDGRDDDLRPAADGEREAVALERRRRHRSGR